MLDGAIPFGLVLALLAAKAFATTASVSSGSPGGVFTPTLFLGAAVGLCFHHGVALLFGSAPLAGAGAYAMAMSSNYNSRPRAAEVLVDGARALSIRARERVEDLFAGESRLPG